MTERVFSVRDVDVKANGIERIPVEGHWLTVLSSTGEFKLGFDRMDPQPGIEAGLAIAAGEGGYEQVVIENPSGAELTVRLLFSAVAIHDNRLNVASGLSINNFPALQDVQGTVSDGLSEITRRGYGTLGASFASGEAAGAQVLLPPVLNVNGAVIRLASVTSVTNQVALFAGTAAPLSISDYTKQKVMHEGAGLGASSIIRDLFLPAGVGFYCFNNGVGNFYFASFDIL